MLYIIISDIHSNIQAFEAAVGSFPDAAERRIISAGDTVGYGANPVECVALMASLGAENVMGNHDAAVAEKTDMSFFNEYAKEAVVWTKGGIGQRERDYLAGLPYVKELPDLTLVHGTLHSPEEFTYMITGADAMHTFEVLKTKVCFVGHSHMPGVYRLQDGELLESWKKKFKLEKGSTYIINAGSVGQPRDGDPRACYCVYDTDKREIEFMRVEYDIGSARNAIVKAGLPHVLADRLLSGR